MQLRHRWSCKCYHKSDIKYHYTPAVFDNQQSLDKIRYVHCHTSSVHNSWSYHLICKLPSALVCLTTFKIFNSCSQRVATLVLLVPFTELCERGHASNCWYCFCKMVRRYNGTMSAIQVVKLFSIHSIN